MLDIGNIAEVLQHNIGGIKKIELTDLTNTSFGEGAQVFTIVFRRFTGELEIAGKEGDGGYYGDQRLAWAMQKKRADIEYMIRQVGNRRVAIRCTDYNDELTYLVPAKLTHSYKSGSKKTDENAYQFVASAIDTYRIAYSTPVELDAEVDEGPVVGTPGDIPGGIPDPDPPGETPSTYLIVRNAAITYTPTATGNTNNRNEVVTDPSGTNWIIDIDGRAKSFGSNGVRGKQTIASANGTSFAITLPDGVAANTLTTDDLIVIRGNFHLYPGTTVDPVQGYTLANDTISVHADFPLEAEPLQIIIL